MKPAPFELHVPRTVDEAVALLREHGPDAKVLAGGQSLIPTMNFRLARPAVLVDVNRVEGLSGISAKERGIRVGATTRQRTAELSDTVRERAPLLHEAIPFMAHPVIRNRGTVGGSVAHADPAAELPAVVVALGATLQVCGPDGERSLAADDFFTELFATALAPDELLVAIDVDAPAPGSGSAFLEIARRHGDYALAGVAATLRLTAGGCEDVRVALVSVGDGPVLAASAARALTGAEPTEEAFREAAHLAAHADIDPPGDIHATAPYRRHLVEVLTARALARAAERARAHGPAFHPNGEGG